VRLSFRSIIYLVFLAQFAGCKKDSGRDMWEFSFTYNGQTYTGAEYGSPMEGQGDIVGIEIRKPDILGGTVKFSWVNNCAFLEPTGMDISVNYNTCAFFVMSGTVDSSKIFTYSSGSGNTTATNCKTKTDRLFNVTYTTCTISGSFSLVLINNAGLTKRITGTFKDPDVWR
jgi:hypothetical protein